MNFLDQVDVARRQVDDEVRLHREQQSAQDALRQQVADVGRQAATLLADYGDEQFVLVKPTTAVFMPRAYRDEHNNRYDTILDSACWTIDGLGPHVGWVPELSDGGAAGVTVLLLADGTLGRFRPAPDLALEYTGWWGVAAHRWISTLDLEPLYRQTVLTGDLVEDIGKRLAAAIAKYERSGITRLD